VEPAPRAHHRLLHGVLGVEGRAEHPVAVARQLPAVALELSLELRCPCRGAHPMSFWTAQGLMGVIVNSKEANNMSDTTDARTRWLALYVLCLASLMIVLDVTIVAVALPSVREALGFSETSLAWVVNGYLLTYGGFLLLGGRLGDLFGHRRLFIAGIGTFTAASLACGLATTQWFLIAARSVQGVGGAVASAVSLSLM